MTGKTEKPTFAKKIEVWKIEKLEPYKRNARIHSVDQIKEIADSIKRYGFLVPILVDKKSREIIAGHGRLAAAKQAGLAEVPVIPVDHLSENERRAYVLADNKLALNSEWDEALLYDELWSLKEIGIDFDQVGFSEDELEEISKELDENFLEQLEEDEDEAPKRKSRSSSTRSELDFDDHDSDDREGYDRGYSSPGPTELDPEVERDERNIVSLNLMMDFVKRDVIFDAINRAQKEFSVDNSGEALYLIAKKYLESESPAADIPVGDGPI